MDKKKEEMLNEENPAESLPTEETTMEEEGKTSGAEIEIKFKDLPELEGMNIGDPVDIRITGSISKTGSGKVTISDTMFRMETKSPEAKGPSTLEEGFMA